jgi:hypothetical protein
MTEGAFDAPFDGGHEIRAQLGGRNDAMHRANGAGPLDAVHTVELAGHVTELLRSDGGVEGSLSRS